MSKIKPYAEVHSNPKGPGDARPTALRVLEDEKLIRALPHLTVLIKGATGGLGLETARAIYATGARTFITTRSLSKDQQIVREIAGDNKDNHVELILLDLTSPESVREAAATFLNNSKTLNILINSAARSLPPSHEKDKSGIEVQFAANHFFLFSLLKTTLLASSTPDFPSRVVVVASVSHRSCSKIHLENLSLDNTPDTKNTMYKYAHSKLANVYFANEIERHYGKQGLHAFSLQPGGVIEDLFREIMDPEATKAACMGNEDAARSVNSPEQGSSTSVWAAV